MKFVNILIAVFLISCTMEPDYKTPASPVELQEEGLEKITWQEFFASPELQNLIEYSLSYNTNLSISYLNIEIAKQNYKLQVANLLPSLNVTGSGVYSSTPQFNPSLTSKEAYSLNASLSAFEVDAFGKFRSAKKSAQASILSVEENSNAVKISLITQVANSYISYITLKQNIDILIKNINLYNEKYKILKAQEKAGVITKDAVYQAEIMLQEYKSSLNSSRMLLSQEKANLDLLVGADTGLALEKTSQIGSIKLNTSKLSQTPSDILLQRPDIRQAEYDLKAANANIGVARAMFFPRINLTGLFGFSSTSLSSLFSNDGWQFSPSITAPIFNGGRNSANLKITEKQKEVAVLNYDKSIQVAFKEALTSLSAKEFAYLELEKTKTNLANQMKTLQIKNSQYKAGAINKIAMIDQQISLNLAQIANNKSIQNNLTATIVVYKTLGQGF
jgi:multidrug efflux system outer membrane protein